MGFEIVVRPVVFPNIRPAPAQSVAPASDPTKGICTIHGASGKHIDLPFSWTISVSSSRPKEIKRRVDTVRVYQKNPDGSVNKENYVDVERANKIWMEEQIAKPYSYAPAQDQDNIEVIERNSMRYNPNA